MKTSIIDNDLFKKILDNETDELSPEQKERVMKYFPRAYESEFLGIVVDADRTLFRLSADTEVLGFDNSHIILWFLYKVFDEPVPWDWIGKHCCDAECCNLFKSYFEAANKVDVCGLIQEARTLGEDVFFDD